MDKQGPLELAGTAFGFVFGNFSNWLKVAGMLAILLAILHTLTDMEVLRSSSMRVPILIAEAIFAWMWHRVYLLPGEERTIWGNSKADDPEVRKAESKSMTRFMWWSALVFIATFTGGVMIALFLIPMWEASPFMALGTGFVSLIIVLGIAARLLPFYPAIAVDDRSVSLGDVFRATSGKAFPLAIVLFIVLVAQLLSAIGITSLALDIGFFADGSSENWVPMFILNLIVSLISLLFLTVGVTANSETYRLIRSVLVDNGPDVGEQEG